MIYFHLSRAQAYSNFLSYEIHHDDILHCMLFHIEMSSASFLQNICVQIIRSLALC